MALVARPCGSLLARLCASAIMQTGPVLAPRRSRSVAFRSAGTTHALLRNILATKLEHLTAATTDSPTLLSPCMDAILATLKLAQEEVGWWATHVDAVPEELPRKEREAERDPRAFHPASLLILLRQSHQLISRVSEHKAKLAEDAAAKLSGLRYALEEQVRSALDSAAMPEPLTMMLKQLPLHCDNAHVVGVDLGGLRLNILRSKPQPNRVSDLSSSRVPHRAAALPCRWSTRRPALLPASLPLQQAVVESLVGLQSFASSLRRSTFRSSVRARSIARCLRRCTTSQPSHAQLTPSMRCSPP